MSVLPCLFDCLSSPLFEWNAHLSLVVRLSKRDVLAHTSHPSSAGRRFVLVLESGDRVQMTLARRSVVTSGTKMVERSSNDMEVRHAVPQDCFFSGPVEGASGHASFSLCEGELVRQWNTGD